MVAKSHLIKYICDIMIKAEQFKAIIFDMDGVIIDSESISDIVWEKAAVDFNIKMTIDILNSCRGSNKHDILIKLTNIYGQDFDANGFLARTGVYFDEIARTKGIPLMPYAQEALSLLKPKYKIALASSTKGDDVRSELSANGLLNFFETLTTGEQVVHSKPDPEIYLMACKSIGLDPKECVAVEDSTNGVKSASAAGLFTVMIPDKIQPTEEIKPLCNKIFPSLKEFTNYFLASDDEV